MAAIAGLNDKLTYYRNMPDSQLGEHIKHYHKILEENKQLKKALGEVKEEAEGCNPPYQEIILIVNKASQGEK